MLRLLCSSALAAGRCYLRRSEVVAWNEFVHGQAFVWVPAARAAGHCCLRGSRAVPELALLRGLRHLLQRAFAFLISHVINAVGCCLLSGLGTRLSWLGFCVVKAGLCVLDLRMPRHVMRPDSTGAKLLWGFTAVRVCAPCVRVHARVRVYIQR